MSKIRRPYYYFQPNQLSVRIRQKTANDPQGTKPMRSQLADSSVGIKRDPDQAHDPFKDIRRWVQEAAEDHCGDDFRREASRFRKHSFADSKTGETVTALFVEFHKDAFRNRSHIVSLARKLNKAAKGRDFGGATVEAVSLNWLGCGAGNGGWAGDGGPGGPPKRVSGRPGPSEHIFTLTAMGKSITNKGEGVTVAVIDTSPTKKALDAAYGKWCKHGNHHPILEALWGPNKRLTLHPATKKTLDRLEYFSLQGHPYSISDHGLFVAGIINSIAPQAEIHLYQALNDHGVCDCESIVEALDKIVQEHGKNMQRLLINCSLFLLVPFGAAHFKKDLPRNLPSAVRPWNNAVALAKWLRAEGRFSEPIFASLRSAGAGVFAAAGNDHKKGNRPEARYPAAFKNVVGVGASAEVGTIASYSNEADEPPTIGITTFGGELGAGKGMLGAYIGGFPKGGTNKFGWARWAGTSFATPVMTGVTAAHFTSPGDNTQAVIARVKTHRGPRNRFKVRQGP